MNFIDDTIILEYSPSQKAFHRESIVDMLNNNLGALVQGGRVNDYVVVGIYPDEDSCNNGYQLLVSTMNLDPQNKLTKTDVQQFFWQQIHDLAVDTLFKFQRPETSKQEFIDLVMERFVITRVDIDPPRRSISLNDLLNGNSF